jgi:hypothetical protein
MGGPQMRHTIVVQSADMAEPSASTAPSSPVVARESSQMGNLQGTVQDLQGQLTQSQALVA